MGAVPPFRQVRALYDDDSVTVHQAYPVRIAGPAVAAGRFVPPFSMTRMTWIKPSFLWMMYRCGWARKSGQERVLSIRISRTGFEWALAHSCLSHAERPTYPSREAWQERRDSSPVRVQWDPERDVAGNPLSWRSIQIGLGPTAVRFYVDEWITGITDITDDVVRMRAEPDSLPMPKEKPYPLTDGLRAVIGAG